MQVENPRRRQDADDDGRKARRGYHARSGICSAMAPAIAPTMAADGIGKAPITPHMAPTSEMWLVRSVSLAAGSPIVRQNP